MTIGYWCVLIAAILPYIFVVSAKRLVPGYNNHDPRGYSEQLTGWPKRAYYAQINGFEAFAPFAAGVIIAHQMVALQSHIDVLAVSFILARILYGILYIANIALLRTLVWALGFACTIGLYFIAI